jgi:hypothetical protein
MYIELTLHQGVTFLSSDLTSHKRPRHAERPSSTVILPARQVQGQHRQPQLLTLEPCFPQQSHWPNDSRTMILSLSRSTLLLEVGAKLPQMCQCRIIQTRVLEPTVRIFDFFVVPHVLGTSNCEYSTSCPTSNCQCSTGCWNNAMLTRPR